MPNSPEPDAREERYRFSSHRELSRLPYFDLSDDGELVLSDPGFGPSVDVHTHLALAYGPPMRVDLRREHPRTEHYLSVDRPLDLEVYANRNFTQRDLKRMTRDLTLLSVTGGGMRRTHTIPNLLREMKQLGVAYSTLLPIELPVLSHNAETYLRLTAAVPELICFGSVHPVNRNNARRLDHQMDMGARGIKIHPAVQLIRPDHPRAMAVYPLCAARKLPVLFHCGPVGIELESGRRRTQVRLYEQPAAENPDCIFVLGHTGALQMEQALDLARRYDNVWLETASQSLTNVRRIVEEGPPGRIMMGSDWPFYHQVTAVSKALLATEGDEQARRRLLYDNAARLLGLPPAAPGAHAVEVARS